MTMWATPPEADSGDTPEWGVEVQTEEQAMLNDPYIQRHVARQRERELIEEANRERLAKTVRDHGRSSDTRRRDGR